VLCFLGGAPLKVDPQNYTTAKIISFRFAPSFRGISDWAPLLELYDDSELRISKFKQIVSAKVTQSNRSKSGSCHVSYYTRIRGPDILRNVIVSGMLHSTKSTSLLQIHASFFIDKMSLRPDENGFAG